jgi:protein gp37
LINSKIQWTDHTWNWSQGCPGCPDSAELGCKNCYARERAHRWRQDFTTPKRTSKTTFNMPITSGALQPMDKVFTLSLGDFFHPLNDPFRPEVWNIIRKTQYDYLILTKFPELIAERLPSDWNQGWFNVWLGVTVENQEMADKRIPILLSIPAAVRFLSIEPILGPITLRRKAIDEREIIQATLMDRLDEYSRSVERGIDWVICGGETDDYRRQARPIHPDWVRSIRDQCTASEVPFFFKSWGEYIPSYDAGFRSDEPTRGKKTIGDCWVNRCFEFSDGQVMVKVGKKYAGNQLDGQIWNQFPGGDRP